MKVDTKGKIVVQDIESVHRTELQVAAADSYVKAEAELETLPQLGVEEVLLPRAEGDEPKFAVRAVRQDLALTIC